MGLTRSASCNSSKMLLLLLATINATSSGQLLTSSCSSGRFGFVCVGMIGVKSKLATTGSCTAAHILSCDSHFVGCGLAHVQFCFVGLCRSCLACLGVDPRYNRDGTPGDGYAVLTFSEDWMALKIFDLEKLELFGYKRPLIR